MIEREQRPGERASGTDGGTVGGTPGRRTLTQSLPATRDPAPVSGAAPFGPVDTPDRAPTQSSDPYADPFGLHLAASHAPSPSAVAAAERAGLGDVSAARLHDDDGAHAVAEARGARALTVGRDVYFGEGEYTPGTTDGDRLLGHELAHVAQQRDAHVPALAAKLHTSAPSDASETEADTAGDAFAAAAAGHQVTPISVTATPATIAFDRKRGRSTPEPGRAALKVTAYTDSSDAIEWTSGARWEGPLPVQYTGTRSGKTWTWNSSNAKSVRVNTSETGAGGDAVEPWATGHGAVRVTIHVVSIDDVTTLDALDLLDYQDPKKRGELTKHRSDALGHALPEEKAGDGSTDQVKPEPKPGAKRGRDGAGSNATPGKSGTRSSPDTRDDSANTDEPQADPRDKTGTGTDDDARVGVDADAVEDDAEADVADTAIDAATDQLLDALGIVEDGEDGEGGGGDKAGGSLDGRLGDDTSADGTGKGGDQARHGGGVHDSRYGRDVDGVDATYDDALGGQKDPNATNGRIGGQEGGRPGGVRGGGGGEIFGFSISIPASLTGAVEVALIIDEGNIIGFGPKMLTKAASEATERLVEKGGPAALRRALKREASEEAARSMRALRKEIAAAKRLPVKQLSKKQRKLLAEWGDLSRDEFQRAMRVTHWEYQRRYFDSALKAAKSESRTLRKAIRRTKDLEKRAALKHRLDSADALAEAASVKPVAGRLPIGHRFAGKEFPRELLPPPYRSKGLRVNADGFPDFEPHALTLPNGKKRVHVELTGGRTPDERIANALADLDETPLNYTWHHDAITGDMMLVPTDLHEAVRHTGNAAVWRHVHGVEQYGK